ncbi:MAG: sulfite exporter TauE/SafE family protein [Patescibacteria group bacterium]
MEYFLIGLLGLVIGAVNAISGGGGVLAVPTLLAFGIPPLNALALNKISDIGYVFGGIKGYFSSRNIDWKLAGILMLPFAVGSLIGLKLVIEMPQEWLKYIIFAGIIVGIFFLLKSPKSKPVETKTTFSITGMFLIFLIGIWDGVLAMAGGIFVALVLVNCFHKNFLQAKGINVVMAIPEICLAATILTLNSTVSLTLFLVMLISSFIGGWIGSHLAVKHGSEFIRKAMGCVAILMIIKVAGDLFL